MDKRLASGIVIVIAALIFIFLVPVIPTTFSYSDFGVVHFYIVYNSISAQFIHFGTSFYGGDYFFQPTLTGPMLSLP